MDKHHRRLVLSFLSLLSLTYGSTTFAAQAIDLSKQNIGALQSFIASPTHGAIKETASLKETNRATDFKQTLHVRVQETYMGYPVWGGDAVIHIPYGSQTGKSLANVLEAAKNKQGFMNGTLYQGLQADLSNTAPSVFTKDQAKVVDETARKYGFANRSEFFRSLLRYIFMNSPGILKKLDAFIFEEPPMMRCMRSPNPEKHCPLVPICPTRSKWLEMTP